MAHKLLFIGFIFCSVVGTSQVGIGTTSPDPAAMLDINAQIVPGQYGGLKLPTVTLAQRANIATPIPDGLMIYVADNPTRCLQVFDAGQGAWMNVYCMNKVPVASGVDFTGTLQVGQTLTATYTYSDFEGNTEFGTTFQWYRASNGAGAGRTAIGGATNTTYTTTVADNGFFIAVGVTPRAGAGASPGVEALSAYREIVTGVPVASDLFISEYIEGSSSNKYIEIANFTGANVDLSLYSIRLYVNGQTIINTTLNLSGTLSNGAVYVIGNSSGTLYTPNITSGLANFNGDDALALVKGSVLIDVFGRIGQDPGTAWTQNGITTLDSTLVRKPGIGPNNDNLPGFPSLGAEWTQFPIDNATNLGSHIF